MATNSGAIDSIMEKKTQVERRYTPPTNVVEPLVTTTYTIEITQTEKQPSSNPDEKKFVSFTPNIPKPPSTSGGGGSGDVVGVRQPSESVIESQNDTSDHDPKGSNVDAPVSQSQGKQRPNSMNASTEIQFRGPPNRSITSGKAKKTMSTSILVETDSQVEASGRNRKKGPLERRNTYNAEAITGDFIINEETQKWAENVKRRLSKRRTRDREKDDDDEGNIIGTRIGEDHVNYVLMYNMLTGIRVGVSRCNAKNQRELNDADFKAAHKLAFDITGNELTPSAKYDFKFKDYAPWVFRHLREFFRIDAADYLVSLTSKYILSELNSPGKSGSFFYFSRDYRFIIKTIHHTEHKFLRKILKEYYEHVRKNPDTLLSRFYGLHRVKLPRGSKIHFVVMNNIFPPHRDIHETYDLKGSTVGREYNEDDAKNKPRAVLKDLNWIKRGRHLELGPEKRELFVNQIEKDVKLLQRLNIMDYSLLAGLHDTSRGNKDNIREEFFVFQPDTKKIERKPTNYKRESKASKLRKAVGQADPVRLGSSSELVLDTHDERRKCAFYMDNGGFAGTDENNNPTNYIYYLGIIDILTPYNIVKKAEHAWRSVNHDKKMISAVHPRWYGQRFLNFMVKTIKFNDDTPNEKIEENDTSNGNVENSISES